MMPNLLFTSADTVPFSAMAAKQEQSGVWKAVKPYLNGGLSGMGATTVIQPIDMVKVRLQLGDKGSPVSQILFMEPSVISSAILSVL